MQAVMPEVVARFHEAFPNVELRLHAMTFPEGIRLLVNGESDLHCGRIRRRTAPPGDPAARKLLQHDVAHRRPLGPPASHRKDNLRRPGRLALDRLRSSRENAGLTRNSRPLATLLNDLFARNRKNAWAQSSAPVPRAWR